MVVTSQWEWGLFSIYNEIMNHYHYKINNYKPLSNHLFIIMYFFVVVLQWLFSKFFFIPWRGKIEIDTSADLSSWPLLKLTMATTNKTRVQLNVYFLIVLQSAFITWVMLCVQFPTISCWFFGGWASFKKLSASLSSTLVSPHMSSSHYQDSPLWNPPVTQSSPNHPLNNHNINKQFPLQIISTLHVLCG